MDELLRIVNGVNSVVWGTPLLLLIISVGVYYTVTLRFFQFTKLPLWLSNTLFALFRNENVRKSESSHSFSQFQAMATSLAATVGTGNIAGVATAISTGGPGSVFWMWFCSTFSMMTSYAENTLGVHYRRKDENGEWLGGPMYYLRDGVGKREGGVLAAAFSLFTLFASFGIGNMAQSNSISVSLSSSLGFSKVAIGIAAAGLTLFVLCGGSSRIGKFTERLVPFMAAFYIGASLVIVAVNFFELPSVFGVIFKNAFSFKAAAGGVGAATVKKAISVGFKRGVFSNEAGLGSTVIVGSCSDVKESAVQGMWGIFQVFVDTLIICSVTALVLLCVSVKTVSFGEAVEKIDAGVQYVSILPGEENEVKLCGASENRVLSFDNGSLFSLDETTFVNVMALSKENGVLKLEKVEGSSLVTLAFGCVFGKWADIILSVSITMFAFSTIVGWSFYGERSVRFLFGGKGKGIYKVLFSVFVFFGAVIKLDLVWGVSDVFNALMAVPNLVGVFLLSKDVKKLTKAYLSERSVRSFKKPSLSVLNR